MKLVSLTLGCKHVALTFWTWPQAANDIFNFIFWKHPFVLMAITVEPIWKCQKCLTKVAKFCPFPCTILYKSCLFCPSWQAISFERPPSCVAFIEGFHCIAQNGTNFQNLCDSHSSLYNNGKCWIYLRPQLAMADIIVVLCARFSVRPPDVTTLITLEVFRVSACNLVGWYSLPWSRSLLKIGMLNHFLVPLNVVLMSADPEWCKTMFKYVAVSKQWCPKYV